MDVLEVDDMVKIYVSNKRKAAELLAGLCGRSCPPLPRASIKREAPEVLISDSSEPQPQPRPRRLVVVKGKVRKAPLQLLSEPEPGALPRPAAEEERPLLLPEWKGRASGYRSGGDAPPPSPPPPLPSSGVQEGCRVSLLLLSSEGSILPRWVKAPRTKKACVAVAPPADDPSPPPLLRLIVAQAGGDSDPLPVASALPTEPSAEHNAPPSSSSSAGVPLPLDLNPLPPPQDEDEAAAAPHPMDPLPLYSALPTDPSAASAPSPLDLNRQPENEDQAAAEAAAAAAPYTDPLPARFCSAHRAVLTAEQQQQS